MKTMLLASLAALCATAVQAQTPSSDEANRRFVESRATQAVIWGMPAVNYDLMLQEILKTGARQGQVIYWGRPMDAKNQTLTPSPDALYFMTFFDTRNGPVVLDLPAGDAYCPGG